MMKSKLSFNSYLAILALGILTPPSALGAVVAAIFDRGGNWSHRAARLWGRALLWVCRIRVSVQGLDRLEPNQTYIVAANHSSLFDIPILLAKLPIQFRWLSKQELFRIPVFGRAMRACGYIPIDRSNPKAWVRSLNDAAAKIKAGASVVVFPEGTRSLDGRIKPFKRGAFDMAIKSQTPILPVTINGAHWLLPSKSLWVRSGPVQVIIHQPVPVRGRDKKQQAELMDQVQNAIKEQYDLDFGRPANQPPSSHPVADSP
jgi:1-acyl-sn-glycerol-3-phosphate acyltransferase